MGDIESIATLIPARIQLLLFPLISNTYAIIVNLPDWSGLQTYSHLTVPEFDSVGVPDPALIYLADPAR